MDPEVTSSLCVLQCIPCCGCLSAGHGFVLSAMLALWPIEHGAVGKQVHAIAHFFCVCENPFYFNFTFFFSEQGAYFLSLYLFLVTVMSFLGSPSIRSLDLMMLLGNS